MCFQLIYLVPLKNTVRAWSVFMTVSHILFIVLTEKKKNPWHSGALPQSHLCFVVDEVALLASSGGDLQLMDQFAPDCEVVGMMINNKSEGSQPEKGAVPIQSSGRGKSGMQD